MSPGSTWSLRALCSEISTRFPGKSNFCVRSSRRLECFLHRLQQHGSVGRKQMFKLPIGSTHADTHSNRYYSLVFRKRRWLMTARRFFFPPRSTSLSRKKEIAISSRCDGALQRPGDFRRPRSRAPAPASSHTPAPGSLTPPATV